MKFLIQHTQGDFAVVNKATGRFLDGEAAHTFDPDEASSFTKDELIAFITKRATQASKAPYLEGGMPMVQGSFRGYEVVPHPDSGWHGDCPKMADILSNLDRDTAKRLSLIPEINPLAN